MRKLKDFVRLDFVTVKPYFTVKNLLIYGALTLFLAITSGSMSSGLSVGMMLGTLFVSYPFAVGEKCGMDALYATLPVSRKTVVLGRYAFTLLLNGCAVLFAFVLASAGWLIAKLMGTTQGEAEPLWTVLLLAALLAVVQSMQLPLYFKFGHAKAKMISLIPFAAIVSVFTLFSVMRKNGSLTINTATLVTDTLPASAMIVVAVLILLLVIFGSYKLSVAFYKKREY